MAFSQFLLAAARGEPLGELFPFTPIHPWDYAAWEEKHASLESIQSFQSIQSFPKAKLADPTLDDKGRRMNAETWRAHRATIQNRVRWLLGEGPEFGQTPVKFGVKEPEELAKQLRRFSIPAAKTTGMRFGENIQGYVYEPGGEGKRPAVIWLAPFQTSYGFIASVFAPRHGRLQPWSRPASSPSLTAIGTGASAERRGF